MQFAQPTIYHTSDTPNLKVALKQAGIKYAVAIGRRQPMHLVHLDCLQEIISHGLQPVIITGSVNQATSPYYDPIKNPLTEEQLSQQLQLVLSQAQITHYLTFTLADHISTKDWLVALSKLLSVRQIEPQQVVIYFRQKDSDLQQQNSEIKPLSYYQDAFLSHGFSVWESVNPKTEYDQISSTPYRLFDVTTESFANSPVLLAAQMKQWSLTARSQNPDRDLLQGVPVTMLDLTLVRLLQEKNITTADILNNIKADSLMSLLTAVNTSVVTASVKIDD